MNFGWVRLVISGHGPVLPGFKTINLLQNNITVVDYNTLEFETPKGL